MIYSCFLRIKRENIISLQPKSKIENMCQEINNKGEIVIYQTPDGTINLDVRLEDNNVWLSQSNMVDLFQTTKQNVSLHIRNILKEGELGSNSTVKEYLTVQQEGQRSVRRQVAYYNLDMIISVGYRVKSQRGVEFRIWANKVLRDYIVKKYSSNVIQNKVLTNGEATGLLRVIADYSYALDTLDKYDYQQLAVEQTTDEEKFRATYENAMEAIEQLKSKFNSSDLFANEKDQSFKSSINTIYQTFGGKDLYPSIEEKAAMLLYLVTKNHSFSDGNKRIAAFLFLWFLEKNGILYKPNGLRLIENNTLVALTLMIAESRTEEKDVIVKVVVNLINRNN
jgi:hypothetical protein